MDHEDARLPAHSANRRFWVGFCLLLAGALLIRCPQLDRRSLWTDELTTLEVIRAPWSEIAADRLAKGHFPTYFWALKAWVEATGESHFTLRLPSAVLNLAAIALLVLYAGQWWGNAAALTAGVLFALHQRSLWAAFEARPYSAALLFLIASQLALSMLLTRGSIRWMTAHLAASVAGVVTHVCVVPVILLQPLWIAWRWRTLEAGKARRLALASVLAAAAAAIAAVAWLASVRGDTAVAPGKDPGLSLGFLLDAFSQVFVGEYRFLGGSSLKYVGMLVGGWALVLFVSRGKERSSAALAESQVLFWLFCAFLAVALMRVTGRMGETHRYFLPAVPAAMATAGVAIGSGFQSWPRRAFGALTGAMTLAVAAAYLLSPGDRLREAVRELDAQANPGEVVFVCGGNHARTFFDFYGPVRIRMIPVDRDERRKAAVSKLLERETDVAAGFWLFLYKHGRSPIEECAHEFSNDFRQTERTAVGEVRLLHFARKSNPRKQLTHGETSG